MENIKAGLPVLDRSQKLELRDVRKIIAAFQVPCPEGFINFFTDACHPLFTIVTPLCLQIVMPSKVLDMPSTRCQIVRSFLVRLCTVRSLYLLKFALKLYTALQIETDAGLPAFGTSEGAVLRAEELMTLYMACSHLYEGTDEKDRGPADDLPVLAVSALVAAWRLDASKKPKYLLQVGNGLALSVKSSIKITTIANCCLDKQASCQQQLPHKIESRSL